MKANSKNYESVGRRFESCRAHQKFQGVGRKADPFFFSLRMCSNPAPSGSTEVEHWPRFGPGGTPGKPHPAQRVARSCRRFGTIFDAKKKARVNESEMNRGVFVSRSEAESGTDYLPFTFSGSCVYFYSAFKRAYFFGSWASSGVQLQAMRKNMPKTGANTLVQETLCRKPFL